MELVGSQNNNEKSHILVAFILSNTFKKTPI